MADSDSSSSSSASSSCAPGEVSIRLDQWGQEDYVINTHRGFRLRIRASQGCGIDNEIFRYVVVRTDSQSGEHDYALSGVCTWPDLEQYPAYEPDQESDPPIVRLDYIDIVVDTEAIALDVWEVVQEEVEKLVNSIVAGQTLTAGDAVVLTGAV